MNVDGSDVRQLTDASADHGLPSWSPDGRHIAFISDRGGNFGVYVMNADGSDVRQLTDGSANDVLPRWSSDGRRIACRSDCHSHSYSVAHFASDRDGNFEIYAMNADGSDLARLTDNSANDEVPSWSPDGRHDIPSCTR